MITQMTDLLQENFYYNMGNVHTAFPAVVKSYNKDERRAELQPSLMRKLPNGEFIDLPIIVDVPVLFLGTKKVGLHFPLEEGDEVLVLCSERCLDVWKDNGGSKIQDEDNRRFTLSDAVCIPGLQPKDFPKVKNNGGLDLHSDDKISLSNEKTTIIIDGENISIDNGKTTIEVKGDKIELKTNTNSFKVGGDMELTSKASGKLKLGNSIATVGSLLDDLCTELIGATTVNCVPGSPVTFNPATIAKITAIKVKAGQVLN